MKNYKLHLIRHGLTEGNLKGLYVGSGTDLPLCPEGAEHLEDLAARFSYPEVDTVFTSPLKRCTETVQILFPKAKHILEIRDLREAHFGEFEGRDVKELVHDEHYEQWITPGSGYTPEGGESNGDFNARCEQTLLRMFEYMIKAEITEAACVTHGGVIMSMLSQRALPTRTPDQWICDPGCGYTVQTNIQFWMRDGIVEAIAVQPEGYLD